MTEQYYLKARFYNPAVARFTQEDTYYGDGLNLYAYCHNNPVSYVDPTGHEAKVAAEKNLIDKYVNGANKYIDKGTDAMLYQAYESGSKTLYTVQNSADAKRLLSDGLPWSTDPHRANLGDGVYAWSSKEDAINYFNIKSK